MSKMSMLRMAGGLALSRTLGQQLASKGTPSLTCSLVPKKALSVSPISAARHFGPQEPSEKKAELHHWLNERYVAIALLPIIPTALIFPHPALDITLVSAMVLHSHWRLSGVAQDYIHGDVVPRIAQPLVLLLSICAFGSLCYFTYSDVGFARAVRMMYTEL